MAYEPSKSKNKGKGRGLDGPEEPDMLPIMNLMVVLIPVLLSAAEMVKIRTLTVNLPVTGGGGGGASAEQNPEVEIQNLEMSVTITKQGFFIANKSSFIGEFINIVDPDIAIQIKALKEVFSSDEPIDANLIADNESRPKKSIKATYNAGFTKEDFSKVSKALKSFREILEIKKKEFPDMDKIVITAENDIDYQTIVSTIDAVRDYKNEKNEYVDLFTEVELAGIEY